MSVKNPSNITRDLSNWFKQNARILPWRSNPDPYWVWLSEIMLQQTQVTTVLPYFDKFIKKFPEVRDLAHATLDEVYGLWAGLGYYSRARNLHKGAIAIAARIHAGHGFPSNRAEWLEVPGVGEYTAGAICSIALNQAEAIVDGNVVRVLSRVDAIQKLDPKKTQIWKLAHLLVNQKKVVPRTLNQALMELGAMVCKPKNPRCEFCPISKECKGKKSPEKYPEPKPKTVWKRVDEVKWILVRKKSDQTEVYLEQNEGKRWRQGLWDFPNAGTIRLKKSKVIEEFQTKYVVTDHKITRSHAWMRISNQEKSGPGKWFRQENIPAVPSPVAKVLKKVFETS